MLIAQALMRGPAIITSGKAFEPHPARVIWQNPRQCVVRETARASSDLMPGTMLPASANSSSL